MTGDGIDADSLGRQRCIDAICARFEKAWQSGTRPGLADFLKGELPPSCGELIHELLAIDEHYLQLAGETHTERQYLAANPEFTEAIHQYFAARANTPVDHDVSVAQRGGLPIIPGYLIEREIGRGGMGVVYLAIQERPRRRLVLKMIRDAEFASQTLLRRFRTEAEAIARLQHPNIVQVFSVGEHDGRAYMALEYVPGGGLDRLFSTGRLQVTTTVALLEQLARTVHFAHQQGVIHRDLKPANIILVDSHSEDATSLQKLSVKIADFGLAKLLEEDLGVSGSATKTGDTLGTPSYMAPEQVRGQHDEIGRQTDVFALGAILFEALTGRPPFEGATAMSTMDQIIRNDPVPPRRLNSRVSYDLETICLKCLEKKPANRYLSAEHLADDLQRLVRGEPIRARPVSILERGVRWCRRHPTAAALITCLCMGLLGVSIALVQMNALRSRERLANQNAREAVDQALVFLAEDEEMVRRGLYEMRCRVLEAVVRLVEQFQAQDIHDNDLIQKLSRAYYDLGFIYETLGRLPEALMVTDRALDCSRELSQRQPEDWRHQLMIALCLNQRGQQHGRSKHLDLVGTDLTNAREVIASLLARQPASADLLVALADNLLLESIYLPNEPGEAVKCLQRAESAATEGLRLVPNHVRGLRVAAQIWQRTATVTRHRNERHAFETIHRTAIERLEFLARDHPADCDIQVQLGLVFNNLCDAAWTEGRFTDAESAARRTVALFERLTADCPKVMTYHWRLAFGYANLAETMEHQNRIADATTTYLHAVTVVEGALRQDQPRELDQWRQSALKIFYGYAYFLIRRERLEDSEHAIERAELLYPSIDGRAKRNDYMRDSFRVLRSIIAEQRGHFQECLALLDRCNDDVDIMRREAVRCLALASQGDIDRAIAAATALAATLAAEGDARAEDRFDVARALIRVSRRTMAHADDLSRQAVECLTLAHERGAFRSAYWSRQLVIHTDLVPLHSRADFIQLLDVVARSSSGRRLEPETGPTKNTLRNAQ